MKCAVVFVLVAFVATVALAQTEQPSPRSALADALRKALQSTIERIKGRVDEHHKAGGELVDKASELADRLKQIHADAGDKVRELVQQNKDRLRELFDRIKDKVQRARDETNTREKRDINDVRAALRDLQADVKGRFQQLAQWVRETLSNKLRKAREQRDRVLTVAREVRDHAREMTKGAVREAVEALRPFRAQLGQVWQEMLQAARQALSRRPQIKQE